MVAATFSAAVSAWQQRAGRHVLPWQSSRDPYRVWVSEIMLQQTQVAAVIPYFERFVTRFPDVTTLADATIDEVLRYWSGLGYYARGRNLHRAAQEVVERYGGCFPASVEALAGLPGVGRSTAAAISVFAFGTRAAILDGNVKRVLARVFAVEGWSGTPSVEKQLWAIAESLLPRARIEAYTQGLMDLGSLVCTRGTPACDRCPVRSRCRAYEQGTVSRYPAPRPRRKVPRREAQFLVVLQKGQVLLERRPPEGIWGGLWSLPEAGAGLDPAGEVARRFRLRVRVVDPLPSFEHGFTHFRLALQPWRIRVSAPGRTALADGLRWTPLASAHGEGIPAPVRALLGRLQAEESRDSLVAKGAVTRA